MTIFKRIIFVFHLLFLPNFLLSQEVNTDSLRLLTNKLGQNGARLGNEGKYTEALEAFKLFLHERKKIYGEKDYFLTQPYMMLGITYKNLGKNDMALKSYELA